MAVIDVQTVLQLYKLTHCLVLLFPQAATSDPVGISVKRPYIVIQAEPEALKKQQTQQRGVTTGALPLEGTMYNLCSCVPTSLIVEDPTGSTGISVPGIHFCCWASKQLSVPP